LLKSVAVESLAPAPSDRFRSDAAARLGELPADKVELSDVGLMLSRLADTPGVRVGKIARIRAAIADGTYETSHKINVVVDRLLEQLRG
jgi:anti-sigma28 factor (negative regulator of flagellin synthesis)